MSRIVRVAHSPDSDDAFMFYALAEGLIDTGDLRFVHELQDIESLNRRALAGELEVSAISIHAYAYVCERYALLPHGASMGEGYGPRLVAREPLGPEELAGKRVAVPGKLTSAYLALKLFQPAVRPVVVDFDRIIEYVAEGEADVGLLIHEGQLTYEHEGLHLVADLGEWWADETGGLPLPLGGNAIRRDLGDQVMRKVAGVLERSIRYALDHREEALAHALPFGRSLDRARGDRFVAMYVNEATLGYGERGRRGVELFMARAHAGGLIPRVPRLDFVTG